MWRFQYSQKSNKPFAKPSHAQLDALIAQCIEDGLDPAVTD
jgi:hypothetical protein